MTSETYQDSSYDRKGQKRPSRPKLLKLTDVSMPHRNRKKTKTKVKERSQSNVRDRIYDDPAYTEDISHLAIPLRRNSGPDKIEGGSLTHKRKTGGHKDSQYSKRSESGGYQQDESSSSDNMPPDPGKHKRGQSLERANIIERSPKKREKRDRSAKQKRNLSLDNALSNSLRRSLEKSESSLKTASFERQKSKQKSVQRQNASESWSSCLAATSDSSKATENEESYAGRKEQSKMQIGKRFLKGEIGIKSFNYYLLKEGLKSSKKFVDKQRNSLTKGDAKKLHSRSEENIYEEIFFVDKNSDNEEHSKYPDCELCMQQCTKENCEYCLADLKSRQYFGSLGRNEKHHSTLTSHLTGEIPAPTAAHILQYQSYNPNNPGVYKIETTPVAFTSDYNPIHQLQLENQKQLPPRRFSRTASQIGGTRINTKSSSSSDSLHHKYAREQSLQELYEYNHPVIYGAPQPLAPYDQKIYKSDSKVSIISEYSIRSESSNRNFRCGEVSDSSLGDSMFSYSTQRRYFGSSESCRFAFECRRCSLDGEKCSFSDTCRYECRNCDCSSSYFSSDFDEYSRKTSTGHSNNSQKSYDCYNDSIDVKQNKYAQDFIKHVSDVKRSIYQAELQHGPTTMVGKPDAYGTIPPPKQMEMKKSMNHHSVRQYHQPPPSRANSSPFKIAPHPPPTPYPTQMMKDVNANRDNKGPSGNNARMSVSQTMDNENSIKIPSTTAATTEIDKSQKFSEGKYALQQTTIQQRTSDSGKHDKKDSLERSSQRKQTGAIPKLSSSSTSPHQSHRSQKTPSTTTNKDNVQRISVPGSKSPHSSPRHATRTLSKDSGIPPERPAIIDHHIASEPKKLITMSSSTKPSAAAAAAIEDSIQQRNAAKEQLPVQDNHKSRKVHIDADRTPQNGQKENSMPAATDCNNDNNGNSGGKDTARPEPKPKDQNTPQVTRKVHTEQTKVKTTCLKPTDWSDYDDEDDDVFLDANTDDTTTTVGARQRCLAVPATPITPCTSELPETGSKSPPQPSGGRDTLTVPTTTTTATTTTAPQPSSPKMQTKIPAPAAPKEDCAENAKSGQTTTSATKGKPAPTTDSEIPTKATANGGSQQQPQQQQPPKAQIVLSDTVKAPTQQKAPQSSELSMKAKQQIVESATTKQVPQKPDAGRGDDQEKSQSSTAASATSITLTEAQRSKAESGDTPASSTTAGETATEETTSATAANAGAGGATSAEEISRESDAAGATLNRSQNDTQKPQKDNQEETVCLENSEATSTDDSKLTKNSTKSSNDLSSVDKIDISDLPLPELPPKKRRNRDKTAITKYNENLARDRSRTAEHLREFQPNRQNQYIAKRRESLELSNRHFSEKLEARKMHYHNLGHITATQNNSIKPTYLFGENRTSSNKKNITDEIFLNKSGWVQVNSKRINDENSANSHNRKSNSIRLENQNGSLKNSIRVIQLDNARDKPVYAVPRMPNSKIEELISRSEARRSNNTSRGLMRPGYKILDPQIASILNERPGFLPVRTFMDNESPPPITPILSPPPAFQDSKTKYKHTNINGSVKVQINPNQYDQKTNKGMVFSRSFEYDRKPADYAETFSKSFDSNLSEPPKPVKRDRSPNFSTLTGNSPNYLTKKENRSRDNSPKYQQIGSTYLKQNETLAYNNPRKLDKVIRTSLDRNDRSRRAQFSRINTNLGNSRFRSFDTNISHRLNSCDSGARSDLSNDEVDDEDDNSTEFLSASYQSQPIFLQPKQRSLTPEKYDTHSAQNSLRKQRSLTPESRSLTPEDRRKKGSQASLSSRPNSGSRNNTLERKPTKYEDKSHSPSRSSSSSSYSGREHDVATPHRRSATRNSKTPEEHRIRRSRSLQLSEKSPSRTTQSHKMVVCLGPPAAVTNQQAYHQPVRNFPPTIRPNQIVSEQVANSRNMRSDIDKSRSFDLDYGPSFSNQPVPARLDFDKSRSFDEDYREQSNNMRYLTDTGVMREDRNILKPNLQRTTTPAPRQTSPQNYGTRLCDHELTYDMLRRTLDRSPIMDFSRDYDVPRPMKGREVMNVGGSELNFLNERIYDHGMKVRNSMPGENSYIDRLKSRDNMTPESELKSMRESLASMNDERMRSGVGDYIYRQPMKGQQQQQLLQHQQQQRSMLDRSHQSFTGSSAPTRGSCTASSCDFWPHCGLTNLNTNKNTSVDHPNITSAASTSDPAKKDAASDDEEDDEGYIIVREGVKKQKSSGGANTTSGFSGKRVGSRSKYNRKSYSLQETGKSSRTDSEGRIRSKPPIYVNSAAAAAAAAGNKTTSASVVFLGEREMPITRERDLPTSPTTTPSQSSPGNGKLSDKQARLLGAGLTGSGDSRFLRPTGLRSKAGTPNNIRIYRKQRSLSLPNVFLQIQ